MSPPAPFGMQERSRCPLCEGLAREVIWTGCFGDPEVRAFIADHHYAEDPLVYLGATRFELVRCRGCDLIYHARVLDPRGLELLYGTWINAAQIERFEASFSHPANRDRCLQSRQTVKHLLRVHALAGSPRPTKVLDFGCGDGRTLRLAAALGMEAVGVDLSITRTTRAGEAGCTVWPTMETALAHVGGTVDAIFMREVLEHLVTPREILQQLAAGLRPGGVILLETPDARTISRAPRNFHEMRIVHPLEHVNAFTPRTLERMARAVGLRPAKRVVAHATTRLRDVLRTELSRLLPRPSTSAYFVRP